MKWKLVENEKSPHYRSLTQIYELIAKNKDMENWKELEEIQQKIFEGRLKRVSAWYFALGLSVGGTVVILTYVIVRVIQCL